MCPGVDSASKNEYQINPGGKGGRCVRLTIYHLYVPMSRNLGVLTSWNPVALFRPVMGQLYLLRYATEAGYFFVAHPVIWRIRDPIQRTQLNYIIPYSKNFL
jgi:hypothetical protein